MLSADIPGNELARLDALYELGLLDTDPEDRFNRYTRIATRLLNMPYALISFIDEDRQWIKASHGLDVKELSRSESICAHTILQNDLLVIDDLSKFSSSQGDVFTIDDQAIGFYAAIPISLQSGLNLGTFCIMDNEPRQLSSEDKQCLLDLAASICGELKLVTDEGTQLTNQRGFNFVGQPVLSSCHRNKVVSTVLQMELNGLEAIRKDHGQERVDLFIKYFSKLMRQEFRDTDIISRMDSNRFAILMANSNEKDALLSLKRIRSKLDVLNLRNSNNYFLDFCVGHSETRREKEPLIQELLAQSSARLKTDIAFRRVSKATKMSPMLKNFNREYESHLQ